MSDTVWVSNAKSDPRQLRPLTNNISVSDIHRAIEFRKRNDAGEPLGPECFPSAIWPSDSAKRSWDEMPDLFFAGSYWAVSSKCADLLRQFDLGNGALYPVQVFKKDRKTPVTGSYFCLNFGNVKQAFQSEKSSQTRYSANPDRYYPTSGALTDYAIAVSREACLGPDIWIDPLLRMTFFISGPLGVALKAAKVSSWFKLKKCRVI